VPAGNPDGGQWTGAGGGGGGRRPRDNSANQGVKRPTKKPSGFRNPDKPRVRLAGGRRIGPVRSFVRVGENLVGLNSDQDFQLTMANIDANNAIARVKEIEPDWTPRSSAYAASFGGAIRKANDLVLEAEARLIRHGRQTQRGLIDIYRRQRRDPDLLGFDRFDREKSVVGYGMFDGLPVFGVNSDAPPYERSDRSAAQSLRSVLIEAYPDSMQREHIGRKPNDAVFHAETTVLLRMARANGGTLRGRDLTIYVERAPCRSCDVVLPLLSRQLGNPTITFVDLSTGEKAVIRNGDWD
jgi:hypothetical protein